MAVVQAQFLAPQENALASAFGKAIGNVSQGLAQGAATRKQEGKEANATTFNGITNRLDAYYKEYGAPGFIDSPDDSPEMRAKKEAARRDLDVWGQTYQAVTGGRVTDDQLGALKNAYLNGVTTAGNIANIRNINTGFAVEGMQEDTAPAPPVDKVTPGSTAATQAAEAAKRAQAAAAPPFNKGQEWLMSATPDALAQFGLMRKVADPSRVDPRTGRILEKYVLQNGKAFYDVNEALRTFREDVAASPTFAQGQFDALTKQYGIEPSPYGLVKPSQLGYSQASRTPSEPLQQGNYANGTVSLETHEERTGDEHYPARVGVEEGIVNAVAMKQPGVAELIMELNRRFPANVAASRGTYADGYAPQEGLVLDEGNAPRAQPTTGEAYMGAVQGLNSAAQDTSATAAQAPQAPVYEPTPSVPGDPLSQRDAQLAQENADRLVSKAKAKIAELSGPAPRHTNKYLAAMDEIAQHARDVQAKYQINWENPDPRERAILQRELAWEQAKTKAAMAADRPRQEWQKMALDNIKNFMRNASDEEIASAFGPEVATARNNRKTQDLGWTQLEIESKKALNEAEAVDTFSRTLAAEVMTKAFTPIMEKFVVDGKFNDEQFSKALSSTPLLKNAADIVSMYMLQAPVAGTANLQQTRSWFPLDRKIYFGFDYSGTGGAMSPSTAGAPQFSSDAESLMRKME